MTPKARRYPHAFPMYSLQKSYSSLDNPNYGSEPVTVTPKLDGAAVSLQYIRGTLSIALTRGDGKQGLDITDNMRFLVPRHPIALSRRTNYTNHRRSSSPSND